MSDQPYGTNGHAERVATAVPGGAGAAILRELALGERSVSELVQATGLSQPNVSNHLARLRDRGLVTAHRQGRQVIYRLASASMAHFLASHGTSPVRSDASLEQLAEEFWEAALSLREEDATRVVDRALASGLEWKALYLHVFVPTLVRVGDMWEAGELPVASEHLITGIVLRLLHRLSLKLPVAPPPGAPSALVGCVEGELHSVGGRMVADFLISQGWRVWFLNGFLPQEHLLEAVRRHLPEAIVLCCTTEEALEPLQRTVDRLVRWRGEQPLPLLVAGGRLFHKPRVVEGLDVSGTDVEQVTREMGERVRAIRSISATDPPP